MCAAVQMLPESCKNNVKSQIYYRPGLKNGGQEDDNIRGRMCDSPSQGIGCKHVFQMYKATRIREKMFVLLLFGWFCFVLEKTILE